MNTKEDLIVKHRVKIIIALSIVFIGSWLWLFLVQKPKSNYEKEIAILNQKITDLEAKIDNASSPQVLGEQTQIPEEVLQESDPSKINLNTASSEELQSLPGIGPAKSADIISYREQNGDFDTIDELIHIKGIGEATLEKLRDFILVD